MSSSRVIVQCAKLGQRSVSSSATCRAVKGEVHPGYQKIKAKYAKFQIDDGTPIHLKGGPFDKVLYLSTLGLCGVGFAGVVEYIYSASFPKKA